MAEYLALDLNSLLVQRNDDAYSQRIRYPTSGLFPHEVEEGEIATHSNPAPQVKELWIEIDIDPYVSATHQGRQRIWHVTYAHLGQMRYLRSLAIKSRDSDHSLMAEFARLNQITNLKHLGLSARGKAWAFNGLYRIVKMVLPWLTSLDLQPLKDIDKANVHRWLAELG